MSQSNKPVEELQLLCSSYAAELKDCGNGHYQISNHGVMVNYWPLSKSRTVHTPNGGTVKHCSPWDALKLCKVSGKPGLAPKKKDIKKNQANFDLKMIKTNPVGLKHLCNSEIPPWKFIGPPYIHPADRKRMEAYELEQRAIVIRTEAEELEAA